MSLNLYFFCTFLYNTYPFFFFELEKLSNTKYCFEQIELWGRFVMVENGAIPDLCI